MDSPRFRSDSETTLPTKHMSKDIELKVVKVLELLKNDDEVKNGKVLEEKRRSEIIRLVEEIHSGYQLLTVKGNDYDRWRGSMRQNLRSRKGNDSASTSDSEYYSSEDKDTASSNAARKATFKEVLTMENKQQLKETKEEQRRGGEKLESPALLKVHENHESSVAAHATEMEAQVTALRTEVEILRGVSNDLKMQIERKTVECKKLGTENLRMKSKISGLESQAKSKEDEIFSVMKKLNDEEKSLNSQITKLMDENRVLKGEVALLRDQKGNLDSDTESDAAARVRGLENRVHAVEEELTSVSDQKTELELQVETQKKEICEKLAMIDNLQEEITKKNVDIDVCRNENEGFCKKNNELQCEVDRLNSDIQTWRREKDEEIETLASERDKLHMKIENLKVEVQKFCHRNKELEEVVRERTDDTDACVAEEKLVKHNEKLELEADSLVYIDNEVDECAMSSKLSHGKMKTDDMSNLLMEYDNFCLETSATILTLKTQAASLQKEIESLHAEKRTLLMDNKNMKQELEQKKVEMECEIQSLNQKLFDQQKILQEKEVCLRKSENAQLVKHLSLDSSKPRLSDSPRRGSDSPRYSQQSLERKIEELADRFHMKMENHIRLLYQRILVAEQIHSETKDNYKKIKEALKEENERLNEKMTAFEVGLRTFKGLLSDPESCSPMEMVGRLPRETNNGSINRIDVIFTEIQSAKDWITAKNNEVIGLRQNVSTLKSQLEASDKRCLLPKQQQNINANSLENDEASEQAAKTSKLELRVAHLEQKLEQREEVLLSLVEEKRDAIKQLCILIDYHQSRCSDMMTAMSKNTTKSQ